MIDGSSRGGLIVDLGNPEETLRNTPYENIAKVRAFRQVRNSPAAAGLALRIETNGEHPMRRLRATVTAALVAAIVIPAVTHAGKPQDAPFDRVVAFGDSLSDAGNVFILTGQQSQAPFAPNPSAPYAIGGHRFTNGATWIEQLAKQLNDPLGGKPSQKRNAGNSNYAFGGARARAWGASPDLTTQVLAYLDANGVADPDALHVIWIGGNDVRDALAALQGGDFVAATEIVAAAAQAIAGNVHALHGAGARSFLIANVPNLAILPAVQATQNPFAIAAAQFLSGEMNTALSNLLDMLEGLNGYPGLAGIEIARLDVGALLSAVHANPEAYGLEEAASPCLSFLVIANAICAKPSAHLFWDAVHPTTRAHRILAEAAYGLSTFP